MVVLERPDHRGEGGGGGVNLESLGPVVISMY